MRRPCACCFAVIFTVAIAGCDHSPADPDPFEPGGALAAKVADPAVCDPGQAGFTAGSTNRFFPLPAGAVWRYEGEDGEERIELQISVLGTKTVAGVITRVVEEREWIDGALVELSRNFYAQAGDGTVCYFGEDVDIFDPVTGQVVSHEGAWLTGGGNQPGIIMPAVPKAGLKYAMERAPGIAEDERTVVGTGPLQLGDEEFAETIRVREFNPLDGDKGYKVFAAGVGLVVDGPVVLVSRNF